MCGERQMACLTSVEGECEKAADPGGVHGQSDRPAAAQAQDGVNTGQVGRYLHRSCQQESAGESGQDYTLRRSAGESQRQAKTRYLVRSVQDNY